MNVNLFIGTYTHGNSHSEGIYVCVFNQHLGVGEIVSVVTVDNPSYLAVHPCKDIVYAVSETQDISSSQVHSFSFNRSSKELKLINKQAILSQGACYIAIDYKADILVTANYLGGSICVFPLNGQSSILPLSQQFTYFGRGVHSKRQTQSHVHCAIFLPDNSQVFASDLGKDCIYIFNVVNSCDYPKVKLQSYNTIQLPRGCGPRHLVFNAKGDVMYLICELSSELFVLSKKGDDFVIDQIVSTDPLNLQAGADIHLHPCGAFLYVSNRDRSSGITVFKVDENTGRVAINSVVKTKNHPRNFVITPNGKFLLVASMLKNEIQVFEICLQTGELSLKQNSIYVDSPVCLKVLN